MRAYTLLPEPNPIRRPVLARVERFGANMPPNGQFGCLGVAAYKPKEIRFPYTQKITRLR